MRDAWTIALKDLRRRMRDRTALLVAVILPFAMAMIFSQTLSGVGCLAKFTCVVLQAMT